MVLVSRRRNRHVRGNFMLILLSRWGCREMKSDAAVLQPNFLKRRNKGCGKNVYLGWVNIWPSLWKAGYNVHNPPQFGGVIANNISDDECKWFLIQNIQRPDGVDAGLWSQSLICHDNKPMVHLLHLDTGRTCRRSTTFLLWCTSATFQLAQILEIFCGAPISQLPDHNPLPFFYKTVYQAQKLTSGDIVEKCGQKWLLQDRETSKRC